MTHPASLSSQLDRLDALEKEATPGPWINAYANFRCVKAHAGRFGHPGAPECEYTFQGWSTDEYWRRYVFSEPLRTEVVGADDDGPVLSLADARLIAELRTEWPSLSSQVRALIEERDRLREWLAIGLRDGCLMVSDFNDALQGEQLPPGALARAREQLAALSRSKEDKTSE